MTQGEQVPGALCFCPDWHASGQTGGPCKRQDVGRNFFFSCLIYFFQTFATQEQLPSRVPSLLENGGLLEHGEELREGRVLLPRPGLPARRCLVPRTRCQLHACEIIPSFLPACLPGAGGAARSRCGSALSLGGGTRRDGGVLVALSVASSRKGEAPGCGCNAGLSGWQRVLLLAPGQGGAEGDHGACGVPALPCCHLGSGRLHPPHGIPFRQAPLQCLHRRPSYTGCQRATRKLGGSKGEKLNRHQAQEPRSEREETAVPRWALHHGALGTCRGHRGLIGPSASCLGAGGRPAARLLGRGGLV